MINKIADLYLTWVNDFLTVSAFAAYLGTDDESHAERVITIGRRAHERRAKRAAHGVKRRGVGANNLRGGYWSLGT